MNSTYGQSYLDNRDLFTAEFYKLPDPSTCGRVTKLSDAVHIDDFIRKLDNLGENFEKMIQAYQEAVISEITQFIVITNVIVALFMTILLLILTWWIFSGFTDKLMERLDKIERRIGRLEGEPIQEMNYVDPGQQNRRNG